MDKEAMPEEQTYEEFIEWVIEEIRPTLDAKLTEPYEYEDIAEIIRGMIRH